MRYTLINDLEDTYDFVDFNPDTCHAEALSYLGYAILPVNEIDFKENGDVQEYACVDKNDLSTVFVVNKSPSLHDKVWEIEVSIDILFLPYALLANANALSAKEYVIPPCNTSNPFNISLRTVILKVDTPSPISITSIPNHLLKASLSNIL